MPNKPTENTGGTSEQPQRKEDHVSTTNGETKTPSSQEKVGESSTFGFVRPLSTTQADSLGYTGGQK